MKMGHDMPVQLIKGGLHVDEKGVVSFVNDFDFKGVDRFYTVKAHKTGSPRGWIGHRRDHKWFMALAGSVIIAVVAPDDWENPSKDLLVQRYTLSAIQPGILHVPPGHATASVMLSPAALLGVFSSGRIEEAKEDDCRFHEEMWGIV